MPTPVPAPVSAPFPTSSPTSPAALFPAPSTVPAKAPRATPRRRRRKRQVQRVFLPDEISPARHPAPMRMHVACSPGSATGASAAAKCWPMTSRGSSIQRCVPRLSGRPARGTQLPSRCASSTGGRKSYAWVEDADAVKHRLRVYRIPKA